MVTKIGEEGGEMASASKWRDGEEGRRRRDEAAK